MAAKAHLHFLLLPLLISVVSGTAIPRVQDGRNITISNRTGPSIDTALGNSNAYKGTVRNENDEKLEEVSAVLGSDPTAASGGLAGLLDDLLFPYATAGFDDEEMLFPDETPMMSLTEPPAPSMTISETAQPMPTAFISEEIFPFSDSPNPVMSPDVSQSMTFEPEPSASMAPSMSPVIETEMQETASPSMPPSPTFGDNTIPNPIDPTPLTMTVMPSETMLPTTSPEPSSVMQIEDVLFSPIAPSPSNSIPISPQPETIEPDPSVSPSSFMGTPQPSFGVQESFSPNENGVSPIMASMTPAIASSTNEIDSESTEVISPASPGVTAPQVVMESMTPQATGVNEDVGVDGEPVSTPTGVVLPSETPTIITPTASMEEIGMQLLESDPSPEQTPTLSPESEQLVITPSTIPVSSS